LPRRLMLLVIVWSASSARSPSQAY
jgi:hypothetical protein